MIKDFRNITRFWDKLYKGEPTDRPTVKDRDIESFFVHVAELKIRVEELEREIVIHALEKRFGSIHPHNEDLLRKCRIGMNEAMGVYREFEEARSKAQRSYIKIGSKNEY